MNMKAYTVTDGDGEEGGTVIVFATNGASARRHGGGEIGCGWEGVESCTRSPEYDQYASVGKVPADVLIADGWWYECHHCSRKVTNNLKEEVWDDGLDPDDFEVVAVNDHVFCSHLCRVKNYNESINKKRAEAALVEYVTTKWPRADVRGVHVYKDKLEPSEERSGDKCSAVFLFGGKNLAKWVFPDDTVWIAQEDAAAWNLFTGKTA